MKAFAYSEGIIILFPERLCGIVARKYWTLGINKLGSQLRDRKQIAYLLGDSSAFSMLPGGCSKSHVYEILLYIIKCSQVVVMHYI